MRLFSIWLAPSSVTRRSTHPGFRRHCVSFRRANMPGRAQRWSSTFLKLSVKRRCNQTAFWMNAGGGHDCNRRCAVWPSCAARRRLAGQDAREDIRRQASVMTYPGVRTSRGWRISRPAPARDTSMYQSDAPNSSTFRGITVRLPLFPTARPRSLSHLATHVGSWSDVYASFRLTPDAAHPADTGRTSLQGPR